jgi:hypothetical protein
VLSRQLTALIRAGAALAGDVLKRIDDEYATMKRASR